jgi:energy-coupling factor transport system permease protein
VSNFRFPTVERESFFTSLDFRSKFFLILVISMISFIWESLFLQACLALIVLTMCLYAGVKFSYVRTIFILMMPFFVFTVLSHGFFNVDQLILLTGKSSLTPLFVIPENWWLIGGGMMSVEGVLYGLNIVLKSLTILLVMPFLLFSTDINNMMVGMVKLRVPYKLAFIFSATLRFFPLLSQEIRNIMDAQRLRGLELEKMNPFQRVILYAKLVVPFILNSLLKSQQLDVVLQAKAFSGTGERTYLHESKLTTADWVVIVFSASFFVFFIFLYLQWGIGKFGGPI